MRGMLAMLLWGAVALVARPAMAADTVERRFEAALALQQARDWPAYLQAVLAVQALQPDSSQLLYRLAGAQARAGYLYAALRTLDRVADHGLYRDPEADPDFASLRTDPRWPAVLGRLRALREPLAVARQAFQVDEPGLLIEGLAYDPASRNFFLSSVRHGRVLRLEADGGWRDFIVHPWALLGLAVDAPRRRLWVLASALPQRQGLATDQPGGRTALLAYGLDDGRLLAEFAPPADGAAHGFNDLALGADGSIYVSDPAAEAIWRLRLGASALRRLDRGGLRAPGGLALSADGRQLYVADYAQGLARLRIADGRLDWLSRAEGVSTLGIDGLVRDGDALWAVVNGNRPHRLLRLRLSADGAAISGSETLERARPDWLEPTLGVLAGAEYCYVGNSQWPLWDEAAARFDDTRAQPTRIYCLPR